MKKFILSTFIFAIVFLAACTSGQQPASQPPSSAVPAPGFDPDEVEEAIVVDGGDSEPEEASEIEKTEPLEEQASKAKVREITLTARRWQFDPNTITVKKGDRIDLEITSIDVTHGFAISAFDVNERLVPGQTTSVSFVADKVGTFRFFCTVFCGSGHSTMDGKLIVEE